MGRLEDFEARLLCGNECMADLSLTVGLGTGDACFTLGGVDGQRYFMPFSQIALLALLRPRARLAHASHV